MKVSNKLQVAMLLEAQADNGFTVNTKFQSPTKGYVVSMSRGELIMDVLDSPIIQNWVSQYYEKVRCNSKRYFGVWKDDNLYYFDISINFDEKALAIDFGIKNKQKAVWNIREKQEIRL